MRLAFLGFRHSHAMSAYFAAIKRPRVQVVGVCEEDAETAKALRAAGKVHLTHDSYRQMLDSVECDAVVVGDVYARRGALILDALGRGKHVLSDKPLCTSSAEMAEIAAVARCKPVAIGCLFDLRGSGAMRTARRLIGEGAIGTVRTVTFLAQHPLLYGSRPAWYFEPGQHGGTINDIGIHAFDAIPWISGRRIVSVVAARAWNARLPQHPEFQDAAQVMLELDNGGGVLGDVSYLAPDGCGYSVPQYWRMTFHGDGGVLECDPDRSPVMLARSGDKAPQMVKADPSVPNCAMESFLKEASGEEGEISPSTAEVLEASRMALEAQGAADRRRDERG